jgi:DNA ligase (NAD+)
MTKKDAEQRIRKLRKLIEYHRTLYHVFDAPEISDEALDALKNELEELEHRYPELVIPTSPTQTVGGRPLERFVQVRHEAPMLSFFDAFSEEEMRQWLERLENFLGHSLQAGRESLFYCELKIDGLAIELVYDNGRLVRGSTRGDGIVGEDITQNLLTVLSIPQRLEQLGSAPILKHLVVRGEVFITKKELEHINKEQQKKGLRPYANARNLAAGSVRQLDPAITASRRLESFQYDIVTNVGQKTHEEEHKILASWGFKVNEHNRAARSLEEIFVFRNAWEKKREALGYEIDGVVVIVNNNAVFDTGGVVGKGPRAAIAYKFSPRQATTVVEDIVVQVGRTGTLTPVAVLRPVEVSGVTVTHSTLHNFDEIKRLDVRVKDTVILTRSGDVIPKVIGVIKELRPAKTRLYVPPRRCPVDGSPLIREGVLVRCSNRSCGAQNRNRILHFASRDAFDIRGLGRKIVDRFLDEGLIGNAADIFFLKEEDVASLERFGEKSARNLITEIEQARTISLDKFLYALGILHVGQETARALSRRFLTRRKSISIRTAASFFSSLSLGDLQDIQDIGPVVAESIRQWFSDRHNLEMLKRLNDARLVLKSPERAVGGVFRGKKFVITGTLSLPRQRIKEIIQREGGHLQSSVSSKTDVVLAGRDSGSKLERARQRHTAVWDEQTFVSHLPLAVRKSLGL